MEVKIQLRPDDLKNEKIKNMLDQINEEFNVISTTIDKIVQTEDKIIDIQNNLHKEFEDTKNLMIDKINTFDELIKDYKNLKNNEIWIFIPSFIGLYIITNLIKNILNLETSDIINLIITFGIMIATIIIYNLLEKDSIQYLKKKINNVYLKHSIDSFENIILQSEENLNLLGNVKICVKKFIEHLIYSNSLINKFIKYLDINYFQNSILNIIYNFINEYNFNSSKIERIFEKYRNNIFPYKDEELFTIKFFEEISIALDINQNVLLFLYYDFTYNKLKYKITYSKLSNKNIEQIISILHNKNFIKNYDYINDSKYEIIKYLLEKNIAVRDLNTHLYNIDCLSIDLNKIFEKIKKNGINIINTKSKIIKIVLNHYNFSININHNEIYNAIYNVLYELKFLNVYIESFIIALLVISSQNTILESISCKKASNNDIAAEFLMIHNLMTEDRRTFVKFIEVIDNYDKYKPKMNKYSKELEFFKAQLREGYFEKRMSNILYEEIKTIKNMIKKQNEELIKSKKIVESLSKIELTSDVIEKILSSNWIIAYLITWDHEKYASGKDILNKLKNKYSDRYLFEKYTHGSRLGIIIDQKSFSEFVDQFKKDLLEITEGQLEIDFVVHIFGRSRYSISHVLTEGKPKAFKIIEKLISQREDFVWLSRMYNAVKITDILEKLSFYNAVSHTLSNREKMILKDYDEIINKNILQSFNLNDYCDITLNSDTETLVNNIENILYKFIQNKLSRTKIQRISRTYVNVINSICNLMRGTF